MSAGCAFCETYPDASRSQSLQSDNPTRKTLAVRLRDIILQEDFDINNSEEISELLGAAASEALFGASSASRTEAFDYLIRLYALPPGRAELGRLGQPGEFLDSLADRVFTRFLRSHS